MGNFTTFLEEKLMPIATKFSTQRHLKAIRDAFICIMPITLAGGIVSVISAAPAPEGTTNGFLLAWAGFVSNNNMILSWINAITMGAMSLYVTIALTSFLAKSYKLDNLLPILLSLCGFVLRREIWTVSGRFSMRDWNCAIVRSAAVMRGCSARSPMWRRFCGRMVRLPA